MKVVYDKTPVKEVEFPKTPDQRVRLKMSPPYEPAGNIIIQKLDEDGMVTGQETVHYTYINNLHRAMMVLRESISPSAGDKIVFHEER